MPTPQGPMPLRSMLALMAFGTIAASGLVALTLSDLAIDQELSLLTVLLLAGIPLSIGLSAAASTMLERSRERIQGEARAELRESVKRFGEALRSTAVVDGEPDVDPLLRVVLQTAVSAVVGARGVVYRFDPAHQCLQPISAVDVEDPCELALGEGIAGWLASHRTNLRLPGPGDAPAPARGEPSDEAVIGVPLETSAGLFGVLVVHGRKGGGSFADRDLETLALLAGQAATAAENVLLHHEARRLSVTDPLTGLANVRAFRERLATEFERSVRFGRPLSLAIVDIDLFKKVNDTFGHQRGDMVLADLATRMTAATRASIDLVARYGGEEFALLLPETDATGAAAVAEKVRLAAAQTPFAGGSEHIHATVSVGFATFPDHAKDPEQLIHAADLALYEAKRAGRNRVGSPTRFPEHQPEV